MNMNILFLDTFVSKSLLLCYHIFCCNNDTNLNSKLNFFRYWSIYLIYRWSVKSGGNIFTKSYFNTNK